MIKRAVLVIGMSMAMPAFGCLAATQNHSPEAVTDSLERRAAAGDATAQYELAASLERGQAGRGPDISKAIELYSLAAAQGDLRSMVSLGLLYEDGRGVPRDLGTAEQWYRRAITGGHAGARLFLAQLINAERSPTAEREQEALALYQQAAEDDFDHAMAMVGYYHEHGLATPRDLTKARQWYERGAAAGSGTALVHLGRWAEEGIGMPRDHGLAARYYRQSADKGNAGAKWRLGVLQLNGWGLPQDVRSAESALDEAGVLGWADLGHAYLDGIPGLARDLQKAEHYLLKAAEAGSERSMHALGVLYSEFEAKNYPEALKWYRRAADMGVSASQNNLGVLYQYGRGVELSLEGALYWYAEAVQNGMTESQTNINALLPKLRSTRVKVASARLREEMDPRSEIVGHAERGATVYPINWSRDVSWLHVYVQGSGEVGWVQGTDLDL